MNSQVFFDPLFPDDPESRIDPDLRQFTRRPPDESFGYDVDDATRTPTEFPGHWLQTPANNYPAYPATQEYWQTVNPAVLQHYPPTPNEYPTLFEPAQRGRRGRRQRSHHQYEDRVTPPGRHIPPSTPLRTVTNNYYAPLAQDGTAPPNDSQRNPQDYDQSQFRFNQSNENHHQHQPNDEHQQQNLYQYQAQQGANQQGPYYQTPPDSNLTAQIYQARFEQYLTPPSSNSQRGHGRGHARGHGRGQRPSRINIPRRNLLSTFQQLQNPRDVGAGSPQWPGLPGTGLAIPAVTTESISAWAVGNTYTLGDRTRPRRGGAAPPTPSRSRHTSRQSSVTPSGSIQTWTCGECGKTFDRRHKMNKHRRIHEPRTHDCGVCNRAFGMAKDLRRHMKSHNKTERLLLCNITARPYSTRGFQRKDHLDRHLRNQHPEDQPATSTTSQSIHV